MNLVDTRPVLILVIDLKVYAVPSLLTLRSRAQTLKFDAKVLLRSSFSTFSSTFQGGTSEGEKEEAKQAQLEENYSFVWGKDRHTHAQTDRVIETDSSSDSHTQTHTHAHTQGQTDTKTHSDSSYDIDGDDES